MGQEQSPASINSLGLHPAFPERVWAVIEQRKGEPQRVAYDPVSQLFHLTETRSLLHVRGFSGVYGWIGGTGIPPDPHFDVLMFTDLDPQPGAVLDGVICGVFFRGDGDHKFVAVDDRWVARMPRPDLSALPQDSYTELLRLYPRVDETKGEGWFGADAAIEYLETHRPNLDLDAILR